MNTTENQTESRSTRKYERRASLYVLFVSIALLPILYLMKGEITQPLQLAMIAAFFWPASIFHARANTLHGGKAPIKKVLLNSKAAGDVIFIIFAFVFASVTVVPEQEIAAIAMKTVTVTGLFALTLVWLLAFVGSFTNAFGFKERTTSPVGPIAMIAGVTTMSTFILSEHAVKIDTFVSANPEQAAASFLGLIVGCLGLFAFAFVAMLGKGYIGLPLSTPPVVSGVAAFAAKNKDASPTQQ